MIAIKGIYSNGKILLKMPVFTAPLPNEAEVMVIFDTQPTPTTLEPNEDDPIIGLFSGTPTLASDAEEIMTREFLINISE